MYKLNRLHLTWTIKPVKNTTLINKYVTNLKY